jgi:hypothetical protein
LSPDDDDDSLALFDDVFKYPISQLSPRFFSNNSPTANGNSTARQPATSTITARVKMGK